MPNSQDIEYKRLLWHSRRGMLELDLILEPFVRERYAQIEPGQQAQYRALLDCEDQQLFNWFLKKEPVADEHLVDIVELVLSHKRQKI